MSTETQQWKVGDVTITSVVEDETEHIPPEFFFPAGTAAVVATHQWVVADYADPDGNISLRVQAVVIETGDRVVVVDPCVGNHKDVPFPFWANQDWPFMDRFAAAGFAPERVDTVVHTHLHFDHIGWDTRLVDGEWVPTFPTARHLYTAADLAWARATTDGPSMAEAFRESIQPIIDAGLADEIAPDADLGDGMRLESSPGHTPGHVSLWIESAGERCLLTGDFMHHPVQFAEPDWDEIGDVDTGVARATRLRMIRRAAESGALVLGTHFASRPAGRVVPDGDVWRFVPEP
jgi:glyoxylase-like metal-dependent hydrolase (beta-lactamase superfamily II)